MARSSRVSTPVQAVSAFVIVACGQSETGRDSDCRQDSMDQRWYDRIESAPEVSCCVEVHGRGLEGEAEAELQDRCVDVGCDVEIYLTEDSALCAAAVYGLAPGIASWSAEFSYGERSIWTVRNLIDATCTTPDDLSGEGELVVIDAIQGAFVVEGREVYDALSCR